jgi:uncharacterized repeat protein (TIGR01451 family)
VNRSLILFALAGAILSVALVRGVEHPAKAADLVDVTVRINCVLQIENPDFASGDGDYFGSVKIGDNDFAIPDSAGPLGKGPIEDDDFCPDWRWTRNVDRSAPIDIVIRLWDSDDGFNGAKDLMDISPKDNDVELNIRFNGFSGTWDVPESDVQGYFAEGDGDHGVPSPNDGRKARIEFQVSVGTDPDQDGDGISDAVENMGIRNIAGDKIVDLQALGADPCRKSIALQIDWMEGATDGHNHRPKDAAIAEAKATFANAPVKPTTPCPYTGFPKPTNPNNNDGINLVVEVSNAVPEQESLGTDNASMFSTFRSIRDGPGAFGPERRPYFHYVLFAHDQQPGKLNGGVCCDAGKDIIVSLGSFRTTCVLPGPNGLNDTPVNADDVLVGQTIFNGPDRDCDSTASVDNPATPGNNEGDTQVLAVGFGPTDDQVGSVREQSITLVHELGHSLGLGHGGDSEVTYKPNYLGIMNYGFAQYYAGVFTQVTPTTPVNVDFTLPNDGVADTSARLDYSRSVLAPLNEKALAENAGIGDGTDITTWTVNGQNPQFRPGNGALNWNGNVDGAGAPIIDAGTVNVDINQDGACVSPGPDGLDTSPAAGSDDIVVGNSIWNGPDHTCNTRPKAGSNDVQAVAPTQPCIVFVGTADTSPAADDIPLAGNKGIGLGPNLICDTTKGGDDIQRVPVGQTEPGLLTGFNDWDNLKYKGRDSVSANAPAVEHGPDIGYDEVLQHEEFLTSYLDPDLKASKSVDKTDAIGGDTLDYSVGLQNIGTGPATSVNLVDTLPNGSQQTRNPNEIGAGGTRSEAFTYLVPCDTTDGTVLTNSAAVTTKDAFGGAEDNTANNTATASTTVHAPVLTVNKTASSAVNAGEAITYTISYANTGSGGATNVTITDTLPAGVYYSKALDLGTGPQPNSVTLNADGTRTLSWSVGALAGNSGAKTIQYTARPSLLFLGGESLTNSVRLTFTNANGCTFAPVTASASTTITVVPPSRNPEGLGFWRSYPQLETAEILARVQATDTRFDGADGTTPNGALSLAEAQAVLVPGGNMDKVLEEELLATYFNLATRRINAATRIDSRTANRLALRTVRDAALYAIGTLPLPVNSANRTRYSNATLVLDEINLNKSEVY